MSDGFIVDINELKARQGVYLPVETEGAFSAPDFEAFVSVSGGITSKGSGLYELCGQISGNVTVPCARCCSSVVLPYDGDLEFCFSVLKDEGSDDEILFSSGGVLDYSSAVSGTIRADMPMAVLCRDDCAGLCTVCGADLNKGGCGCEPELLNPVLKIIDLFKE